MNQRDKLPDATLDPALADHLVRACDQYDDAWQEALRAGRSPPDMEPFLQAVAEPFRPLVRREFERIQREYQAGQATPSPGLLEATLSEDGSPNTAQAVGDATIVTGPNLQTGAPAAAPDPSATIDVPAAKRSPAPPRRDQTVDYLAADGNRLKAASEQPGTVESVPGDASGATCAGDPGLAGATFSLAPDVQLSMRAGDEEGSIQGADQPHVPGYEIVGELGRGGMGVVYKARQKGLNRWVALKMVLAGAHAGALQLARFRTEAEAIAHLQHPNIVQVYDIGEHQGLPYFSLEFVDGGSLDKKVHRQPQPPREAAHMIETLARAMAYAHEHGIIHRDLKPANILLTPGGVPKITDFGLAKRFEEDSSQTKSGTLMGTPSYMAPEQARGEIHNVGPLADQYALGAMLYELLTGRPPFLAATPMETVVQVTRDEPAAPTRLQPTIPPDLETICLKCLQKEMGKRYGSTLELADDLGRFLAGEPIEARPVGNMERLWRWCKRNPKLAAATAAISVLLFVVSIGSTWAAFAISAQKKLAEENAQKAEDQKAIAQENERIAETQAELALDSFRVLITQVERQVGKQPGMQQLKRDLLQTALSGLQRVTGGSAGKRHRYTNDAYFRMGGLARQLGKTEDAYRYWRQYYDAAQSDLTNDPANEFIKLELAWACRFLGQVSAEFGNTTKALDYHQRALELRKELAAVPLAERMRRNAAVGEDDRQTPIVNELQVSEEYTYIGVLRWSRGESALAEEPVLKSLAIRENILSELARDNVVWFMNANPAAGPCLLSVAASLPRQLEQVANHRLDMARNYHLIGDIYFRLRNLPQSRLYYQKCEEIREELLREDERAVEELKRRGRPQSPDYSLMGDLAEFHQMYGILLLSLGAPSSDVLPHIDRAIALSRRVLEIDKSVEYHQNLAAALYSRGIVAARAGDRTIANKCFGECLEIRQQLADKDPQSYKKKLDLLEVLARVGEHGRAAQLAEQLRAGHEKDSEFLICAARSYAQCSTDAANDPAVQQRYLDLALAALQIALEQGYKDTITLETHPDFDPIRKSPSFKKLLARVNSVARS
jgi:serine/threonine-protein kinase